MTSYIKSLPIFNESVRMKRLDEILGDVIGMQRHPHHYQSAYDWINIESETRIVHEGIKLEIPVNRVGSIWFNHNRFRI